MDHATIAIGDHGGVGGLGWEGPCQIDGQKGDAQYDENLQDAYGESVPGNAVPA